MLQQKRRVIRTSSGTRKIPIAEDSGEASWIDEGEEIPEADTTFGQTTLAAYKMGTMIKISNELLHDSAFDLASYIARSFGVRMGNAEEKAFPASDNFSADGVVYIWTEKGNDGEKYETKAVVREANQHDFDVF